MAELDVAVIIVTYKSAALTIDCLRSVGRERAGSALGIRCVVVDNASGDAPAIAEAIVSERWGDWVTLIVAARNGGFAYGNNLGIRRASADAKPDYVHLLNPDTVLHPGAIEGLVAFLEAHPQAGIAGGTFENGDGSEWSIAFRFPSLASEFFGGFNLGLFARWFPRAVVPMQMGAEAKPVDWLSGASMMVRRKVLDAIGGMDEGFFLYFEETEFCFRAKAAGHGVWYVPDSRVIHIAGQSTKVTERNVEPRRLPGYWYASRQRYFSLTHGTWYAAFVDLAAIAGHTLGSLKRLMQPRATAAVPHFRRDLWSQSPVWRRNRRGPRDAVPRF